MVTTPILLQPGIKVQMPKAENSENTPDKTITILINAQGGIVLDKSKVSIEDMKAELVRRLAASPDTPVVLKADKDVRYDVVVSVIDAAKGSGAKRFALGVEAKPGETPVQ
jgi:biopolymer transport protein ExbD